MGARLGRLLLVPVGAVLLIVALVRCALAAR
jgi:hypothetical protein